MEDTLRSPPQKCKYSADWFLVSPLVFLRRAAGVTVCVLSVLEVQPGEIGDTLLLSRLEKGSAPVTVRIPTTQREVGK